MAGERCPWSGEVVDEHVARVNGALAFAVVVAALLGGWWWLLPYLVVDFGIKLAFGFKASPNCVVARRLASVLRLRPVPVDSAPKRFAATIGLVMSAVGAVAGFAGAGTLYAVVLAVFAVCAGLEAFAGFCVGCILYGRLPSGIAEAFVRRVATTRPSKASA